MKVLIVYEYKDSEVWSTPLSLLNAFNRIPGIICTRRKLIHNEEFHDEYYDIIVVCDWKGISPIFTEYKKMYPNVFLIRESGDTPQNYDNHRMMLHRYDFTFTPDFRSSVAYNNLGYWSSWITHFADPDIHKIYPKEQDPVGDYYPVRSTRGPGGSMFLDTLSKLMPDKFLNKNGMLGEEYGRFLSGGLITVQNSRWGEITRRLFEAGACGSMILTDRLDKDTHIDDIFVENESIVYYDNMQECISKINYYLANPDKAREIAMKGREVVMNGYTSDHVAKQLIDIYNIWKSK